MKGDNLVEDDLFHQCGITPYRVPYRCEVITEKGKKLLGSQLIFQQENLIKIQNDYIKLVDMNMISFRLSYHGETISQRGILRLCFMF